jgi:hypothetical protein
LPKFIPFCRPVPALLLLLGLAHPPLAILYSSVPMSAHFYDHFASHSLPILMHVLYSPNLISLASIPLLLLLFLCLFFFNVMIFEQVLASNAMSRAWSHPILLF